MEDKKVQTKVEIAPLLYAKGFESMGGSPFETLYKVDNKARSGAEWQVHHIFDLYDFSTPHLGCTLIQQALVDDRLLRAELMFATVLMAGRLRLRTNSAHRIVQVGLCSSAPVFATLWHSRNKAVVYSFSGNYTRVVQLHYEHPNLIFLKTQLIDFGKRNIENLKLMLRWMMNIPATFNTAPAAKHVIVPTIS